jgi:hypothetical protein
VLGLENRSIYEFIAGAQYRVTAKQIQSRPLSFWKSLLELCDTNEKTPWVCERLWPDLFQITNFQ